MFVLETLRWADHEDCETQMYFMDYKMVHFWFNLLPLLMELKIELAVV